MNKCSKCGKDIEEVSEIYTGFKEFLTDSGKVVGNMPTFTELISKYPKEWHEFNKQ